MWGSWMCLGDHGSQEQLCPAEGVQGQDDQHGVSVLDMTRRSDDARDAWGEPRSSIQQRAQWKGLQTPRDKEAEKPPQVSTLWKLKRKRTESKIEM